MIVRMVGLVLVAANARANQVPVVIFNVLAVLIQLEQMIRVRGL